MSREVTVERAGSELLFLWVTVPCTCGLCPETNFSADKKMGQATFDKKTRRRQEPLRGAGRAGTFLAPLSPSPLIASHIEIDPAHVKNVE